MKLGIYTGLEPNGSNLDFLVSHGINYVHRAPHNTQLLKQLSEANVACGYYPRQGEEDGPHPVASGIIEAYILGDWHEVYRFTTDQRKQTIHLTHVISPECRGKAYLYWGGPDSLSVPGYQFGVDLPPHIVGVQVNLDPGGGGGQVAALQKARDRMEWWPNFEGKWIAQIATPRYVSPNEVKHIALNVARLRPWAIVFRVSTADMPVNVLKGIQSAAERIL